MIFLELPKAHIRAANTRDGLPNRVCKASVYCTRVDEVTSTHLFQVPQSLELWSVNDGNTYWMKFYVTVHRVTDDL